jgi:hypothetical protein
MKVFLEAKVRDRALKHVVPRENYISDAMTVHNKVIG